MGLGKTLSCIGLMMANPAPANLEVIHGDKDEVLSRDMSSIIFSFLCYPSIFRIYSLYFYFLYVLVFSFNIAIRCNF
jgi:hypothetical protein